MKKKAYIILTTVLLLISPILYRPFKIYGAISLSAPFIGVNVNVYDQELIYKYTISGTASDNTSNRNTWMCVTWGTTGCKTYQNVTTDGATYTNQSTITFNNTSIQGTAQGYKNIYELEFILDNTYIGEFTARAYNGSDYKTINLVVNGSSAKAVVTDLTAITDVTITNVNLNLFKNPYNQWSFPQESITPIMTLFNNGFNQVGFNQFNNYSMPIFEEDSSKYITNTNTNYGYIVVVLYTSRYVWNATQFNNYFSYSSDFTIDTYEEITRSQSGYIVKVIFKNKNTNANYLQLKSKNNGGKFTVFFNIPFNDFNFNVSTDFALLYRLNNDLLRNIDLIANGNNQTDQSVSDSDTTNQQAEQTFAQEEQLVNNAEQDLQDNLDNLDIQNQNNNLFGNSKFVASAQWVKLQFDNLTNNNAFGYMITFSLVIGLALVIVGKLRG